jgi:diguanylate cyclase (GGDEF)-like protein
VFLDLVCFKHVNDTLDHAIGDDLLVAVAQKPQGFVRNTDTMACLGGDEFVIMLDNPANQDEVVHIANRIITVINEPMAFGDKVAQEGTSISIALFHADGISAVELIKSADNAMYATKRAGKNVYRFFVP